MTYNRPTKLSYLHIQVNGYLLNKLKSIYNKSAINKKELSDVLGLSTKSVSNKMSSGKLSIKHIKLGTTMQSTILFPIVAVAEYLTEYWFTHNHEGTNCNTFLDIEVSEYLLNELYTKYKNDNLSKSELAHELSISAKTLSNRIFLGSFSIRYIRTKGVIKFPIIAIAEFLTKELYISATY